MRLEQYAGIQDAQKLTRTTHDLDTLISEKKDGNIDTLGDTAALDAELEERFAELTSRIEGKDPANMTLLEQAEFASDARLLERLGTYSALSEIMKSDDVLAAKADGQNAYWLAVQNKVYDVMENAQTPEEAAFAQKITERFNAVKPADVTFDYTRFGYKTASPDASAISSEWDVANDPDWLKAVATFYRERNTAFVDDNPIDFFEDPENKHLLDALTRGEIPDGIPQEELMELTHWGARTARFFNNNTVVAAAIAYNFDENYGKNGGEAAIAFQRMLDTYDEFDMFNSFRATGETALGMVTDPINVAAMGIGALSGGVGGAAIKSAAEGSKFAVTRTIAGFVERRIISNGLTGALTGAYLEGLAGGVTQSWATQTVEISSGKSSEFSYWRMFTDAQFEAGIAMGFAGGGHFVGKMLSRGADSTAAHAAADALDAPRAPHASPDAPNLVHIASDAPHAPRITPDADAPAIHAPDAPKAPEGSAVLPFRQASTPAPAQTAPTPGRPARPGSMPTFEERLATSPRNVEGGNGGAAPRAPESPTARSEAPRIDTSSVETPAQRQARQAAEQRARQEAVRQGADVDLTERTIAQQQQARAGGPSYRMPSKWQDKSAAELSEILNKETDTGKLAYMLDKIRSERAGEFNDIFGGIETSQQAKYLEHLVSTSPDKARDFMRNLTPDARRNLREAVTDSDDLFSALNGSERADPSGGRRTADADSPDPSSRGPEPRPDAGGPDPAARARTEGAEEAASDAASPVGRLRNRGEYNAGTAEEPVAGINYILSKLSETRAKPERAALAKERKLLIDNAFEGFSNKYKALSSEDDKIKFLKTIIDDAINSVPPEQQHQLWGDLLTTQHNHLDIIARLTADNHSPQIARKIMKEVYADIGTDVFKNVKKYAQPSNFDSAVLGLDQIGVVARRLDQFTGKSGFGQGSPDTVRSHIRFFDDIARRTIEANGDAAQMQQIARDFMGRIDYMTTGNASAAEIFHRSIIGRLSGVRGPMRALFNDQAVRNKLDGNPLYKEMYEYVLKPTFVADGIDGFPTIQSRISYFFNQELTRIWDQGIESITTRRILNPTYWFRGSMTAPDFDVARFKLLDRALNITKPGQFANFWTRDVWSFNLFRAADDFKLETPNFSKLLKGIAYPLALTNMMLAEQAIETVTGEDLTIQGEHVDFAGRTIAAGMDLTDFVISNAWALVDSDTDLKWGGQDWWGGRWTETGIWGDRGEPDPEEAPAPKSMFRSDLGTTGDGSPKGDDEGSELKVASAGGNADAGSPPSGSGGGSQRGTQQGGSSGGQGQQSVSQQDKPSDDDKPFDPSQAAMILPGFMRDFATSSKTRRQAGDITSGVGDWFSRMFNGGMGLFKDIPKMLGDTWGPIAQMGAVGLAGVLGWNLLGGVKNFFTGGGIWKIAGVAALGLVAGHAFDYFSGSSKASFDYESGGNSNADARPGHPGRTTLNDYRAADAGSTGSTFVAQSGGGITPPRDLSAARAAVRPDALTTIASAAFHGDMAAHRTPAPVRPDEVRISDHLQITGQDGTPGVMARFDVADDPITGRPANPWTDMSALARAGDDHAFSAQPGYSYVAAQSGLGASHVASAVLGTHAAAGSNPDGSFRTAQHLPTTLASAAGGQDVHFDTAPHRDALAATGWQTATGGGSGRVAPQATQDPKGPVKFEALSAETVIG